jgi:hypothetical protein
LTLCAGTRSLQPLFTFIAILTPHHGASGFAVTLFVLFAFVIAEIVNYAARIIYYRRGV